MSLVGLGALLVAAVMTWPTLAHPATTIPADLGDPLAQAYLLGWDGHALRASWAGLWDTNSFYPAKTTLAYSDSLLGYAPFALIGSGPTAALVRYNILFWLVAALASAGAYALARQLGARIPGALVAGLVFAYAPWRLAHAGHLNVLSSGGIVVALAMLARGYGYSLRDGYSPERVRPVWIMAGWLTAAWQLTIGFAIGLPFVYVLLLGCLVAAARWAFQAVRARWVPATAGSVKAERTKSRWWMVWCTFVGGWVFAMVVVLMGLPYLRVAAEFPFARRTVADLRTYSPPLRGFLLAPDASMPWGKVTEFLSAGVVSQSESALLPGFTVILLAAGGLFVSVWGGRRRIWLGVGAVVFAVLCLGTNFLGGKFTYLPLLVLPGWEGLRTPGRLILWVTLVLALLAAGFLTRVQEVSRELVKNRGWKVWRGVIPLLPVVMVAAEGLNVLDHPTPAVPPVQLRTLRAPILVLPSDGWRDTRVMWWSTDGFPAIANGSSSIIPPDTKRLRRAVTHFPDARSVKYLRDSGIRTVVLTRSRVRGTPWEHADARPTKGLGIRRASIGDATVFTLS